MIEPTIWMQLGISDTRYRIVEQEINSIVKTGETSGNMMLMLKDSAKLSIDEKYYAAYMIAKKDIVQKLMNKMPQPFKGTIAKIMEE